MAKWVRPGGAARRAVQKRKRTGAGAEVGERSLVVRWVSEGKEVERLGRWGGGQERVRWVRRGRTGAGEGGGKGVGVASLRWRRAGRKGAVNGGGREQVSESELRPTKTWDPPLAIAVTKSGGLVG